MANLEELDIEENEKRIIRIIRRINNDRNRACYQNILAFAKREDKDLEMEDIRVNIDNLIEQNIVVNIKKDNPDMESFKLVKSVTEDISLIETQKSISDLDNENRGFINDEFNETILNKIKEENPN